MITGLANLAVKVADLEAACRFYESAGAEVRDRMAWRNGERADLFLGPVMITLFTQAIYEDEVDLPEEGFLHPALFTDDLEAELVGHTVIWGPEEVEGTFGRRRIAFVAAPGGIRLEFMEQLEPPAVAAQARFAAWDGDGRAVAVDGVGAVGDNERPAVVSPGPVLRLSVSRCTGGRQGERTRSANGSRTAERAETISGAGRSPVVRGHRGRSMALGDEFEGALAARFADSRGSNVSLPALATVCAQVTDLQTSIVLAGGGEAPIAAGASEGAAVIDELQFTLGEGPTVDAQADGRPVMVDDLFGSVVRWMHFVPAAHELGVRAAYTFPLQVGVIRTGVLSLYGDRPHPLGDTGLHELTTLAELVTESVLSIQSGAVTGALSATLSGSAEHPAVVHQATGMVSVQVGCSVQDAYARPQARAFSDGIGLGELARRVVERDLRFER